MDQKSPDAFRTISEVAEWLGTPAHVLRFWESRFPQVKPIKRAGGRRYYRPADMALLGGIKKLLHDDGMTIRGVQKILRAEGVKHVAAMSPLLDEAQSAAEDEPAEADNTDTTPAQTPPKPENVFEAADAATQEEVEMKREPSAPAVDSRQPEFLFDQADEPAPARIDLSVVRDVPPDDDPVFDAVPPPIPIRDSNAVRARLQAHPALTSALYERLVVLAGRMPMGRQ